MPLVSAAEELPLRTGSLDLVTAFNCVHHFDLARFLTAVARVLQPGGQLFAYTRTPQQNARTIWGRYFPGFTEHEQRLHSEAAFREAVRRTGGLTVVATQTFRHPRSSTAGRLRALIWRADSRFVIARVAMWPALPSQGLPVPPEPRPADSTRSPMSTSP